MQKRVTAIDRELSTPERRAGRKDEGEMIVTATSDIIKITVKTVFINYVYERKN